jgi:hypothetical protein
VRSRQDRRRIDVDSAAGGGDLSHHRRSEARISHDDSRESGVIADASSPPLVDGVREIGAYKLLSVLGEGGMGVADSCSP